MKTSDQLELFATALAKAQKAFPEILKDKQVIVKTKSGGEYDYYFAELSQIVEKTRAGLADNGLSFFQGIIENEKGLLCRTRLLHSSGQWVETDTPIIMKDVDMQGLASAYSYSRRYAITAILGLASESDNDGDGANRDKDSAQKSVSPKPQTPQMPAAKPGQITVEAKVTIAEKELAKSAGFKWSGKKWIKNIDAQELMKNSYPFEILEVRS